MQNVADEQRIAFADCLLAHFDHMSPFTSSKSELDLAIFRAVVDSRIADLASTDFELALALGSTPTRIAALRYRLLMERASSPGAFEDVARHVIIQGFESDSDLLLISVEEKFYRDRLQSEFRKIAAFTDGSHRAAILKVSADDLFKALENLNPQDSIKVRALVKKFVSERRATSSAAAFKGIFTNVATGVGGQLLSQVLGL
ncbi:MAG: hypothetical protein KGL77_02340 [Actinomycetales bacterium]|nr:hypothetical protein [Actinomycetales bacterium]